MTIMHPTTKIMESAISPIRPSVLKYFLFSPAMVASIVAVVVVVIVVVVGVVAAVVKNIFAVMFEVDRLG